MITVTLTAKDRSTKLVGKFGVRQAAYAAAKRAAGYRPTLAQIDQAVCYVGERGTAWIVA
jgi:hypothetical protein